ncbi:unnamed protein product [Notodromas monacha]|uniref:Reelin domain-containing protein n=1 Tax=Notodromas monacha TaxID=399045 RepID=A0A7R9BRC0_9CRUS|nr:unnamed protein product [Notodromas monacha]CAG0920268.1 unnamed protein product [Notodromas monacha]
MMERLVLLVASVIAAFLIASGQGHPTWARDKAKLCETMKPAHGASAQPNSTFPDFFSLNASAVAEEGGYYHVQLDALDKDVRILGYLIEARDACTGEILSGNWNTAQADQILSCNAKNGVNAVHHRPRKAPAVTQVKHAWVPLNSVTSLNFMVSVVHKKDLFWVKESIEVVPCKN